ncbi:hypothetical protein C357_00015 [Citreicella sp. 357]|nr:hypothetical protein C357_00015 [Citreicella sp. 357]
MAIDATELETLRDNLVRARAGGTRVVMYDGKRVEYATDTEMAATIADLDRRIAGASGARPSRIRFTSSKGV